MYLRTLPPELWLILRLLLKTLPCLDCPQRTEWRLYWDNTSTSIDYII
jgi:hypothetical protein